MKKILFIFIVFFSIFTFGCSKKEVKNKIYLDNEFYDQGKLISIKKSKIEELKNKKSTYILYTYNNFCTMKIPCENIFKEFISTNNISFFSIPFDEFKETYLYDSVKYAPTVIIIQNGKVIDYLDANKDSDYDKYQDVDEFANWMKNIIYLEKK